MEAAGRGKLVKVHFQRNSELEREYLGTEKKKKKAVVEGVVGVLGLR